MVNMNRSHGGAGLIDGTCSSTSNRQMGSPDSFECLRVCICDHRVVSTKDFGSPMEHVEISIGHLISPMGQQCATNHNREPLAVGGLCREVVEANNYRILLRWFICV